MNHIRSLHHSSKLYSQFTKFQKRIVDVSYRGNQLYRMVPVGWNNKDSTGTLDISTKTNSKHFSKFFTKFTKSQRENVETTTRDPHIGLMGHKNPIIYSFKNNAEHHLESNLSILHNYSKLEFTISEMRSQNQKCEANTGKNKITSIGGKTPITLFYSKIKDLKYVVYRPLQAKLSTNWSCYF